MTITDLCLLLIIAFFLFIPIGSIFFLLKRSDLKFRRILFSFSLLSLSLALGMIDNFQANRIAFGQNPMIGVVIILFISLVVYSLISGYRELLTIPNKSDFVWTQKTLNKLLKKHNTTSDILKKQEEKILKVIANSPVTTVILNNKLQIEGFNKACLNFLGYTQEDMAKVDLGQLFYIEKSKRGDFLKKLKSFDGGKQEFIQAFVKKDGKEVYGKVIIYSILQEDKHQFSQLMLQILDITKEVELQQKTRTFNKLLQEKVDAQTIAINKKNQNLTHLNRAMSHDLKAPIKNLEALFQSYMDLEEVTQKALKEKCANHIFKNIYRLNDIIRDLTIFFNNENNAVERISYNPRQQVEDILEEFQTGYYQDVTVHLKIGKLPNLFADKKMMYHVWQNLIGNAFKYRLHQESVDMEIQGFKKSGQTIFSIKDNGIGFPNSEQAALFQPFKRLSSSKHTGSGLGLAISKEIIEKHNGSIWAESILEQGSTFYFALPKKETVHWYGSDNYDNLLKTNKGVTNLPSENEHIREKLLSELSALSDKYLSS